jgi:class 3 adenylate cyclase/tetratricopeptide (TPR) repeat protein
MRCSNCGSDNREGRKFCANCGAALTRTCPKCGSPNHPDEKFCGNCGAGLAEAAGPMGPEVASIAAFAGGERHHLTVLFCDLVGSTEIAAQLDPEDWRELVAGYHHAAAEAITRYGGQVAKYLGDGVMAFFGYPEAHDNDAERAVRAGLALLDTIAQLNRQSETGFSRSSPVQLAARVGIDSGAVVVGAGAGKVADVFGEAPNIAARVQAAAEPGTVLITDAMQRLVSGLFVVESRGVESLKGIERPLQLYKVVQPSGVRGRLEAAAATRGLTPFVGREDELRSLMTRWERSREGEGQVALIIGEAGIGKSRLLQRFHELISDASHLWLEAAAAPFFQNTPFHAITELLRQLIGQPAVTDAGAARATASDGEAQLETNKGFVQLESALLWAGLKPIEAIPLIAPLLNLPASAKYPPPSTPPEQQRRRLLAILVEWVLGAARAQPSVIAIEDLHWADASTLEVIQLLVEQGPTVPLLLMCTARPEFHPQWPRRGHHTQINVNRLSIRNVREMIAQVAARNALAGETVDTVIERTGGVPLFVEELTRAVLEGGKLTERAIPITLHDSLMARLDRLGRAKEVAQIGAVIGAEFSYDLLLAVHSVPEADLQMDLRRLTDAELLYVRGLAPDATYQFKHALIRDAAYEAMLKTRRKELHLAVARVTDERFPTIKETHPEVLARHWTEAGETEPAISAWQKAGERAVERRAYREAEQHYRSALAALLTRTESPERDARESILQLGLGDVLAATMGWAALDTTAAYTRARTLSARAGFGESLEVVFGLWTAAISRCELSMALPLADQLLEIARKTGRARDLVHSHFAQALTHASVGNLIKGRQQYSEAIKQYRENDFLAVPIDYGIQAYVLGAIAEWLVGYPNQALRYIEAARLLGRRLDKPFAVAFACGFGALTDVLCGDFAHAHTASQEAEKLGTDLGFPFFHAASKIVSAWARAHSGENSGVVDSMRAGLAELETAHFFWGRGLFLSLLAEAQALGEAVDEALKTIEEALEVNPQELWCRPLTLTLRGELRLRDAANGGPLIESAERDFRDVIDLARKMSARSPELRATTSLARLLRDTGRRDEANSILAKIYNWFTEGFDTADLKNAKALLDELNDAARTSNS